MFLLAILASSLAAANRYFVHNLASDLRGVADQEDNQLINPWDFTSFNVCTPPGSPSCKPPDISSVLIANSGTGMVSQFTPIPGIVEPQSYPSFEHGITGIMGSYALPQQGTNALASGLLFCTEDGSIVGWESSLQRLLPRWSITPNRGLSIKAVLSGAYSSVMVSHSTTPRTLVAERLTFGIRT
jgi:hypothetical protein